MDSNEKCQKTRAIKGTVWCDDHTDVYIGDCKKIGKRIAFQNHPKPTSFETKATCCNYLYFVCWSNDSSVNGFLAALFGANSMVTGSHSKWEVLPTGIDFDSGNKRPDPKQIQQQLENADCSQWKKVAIGQPNTKAGKPFGHVITGINTNARYIWYDSGKDSRAKYPTSPHVPFAGFNHDEFLIFRFPVKELFKEECHDCKCSCECTDDCHCSICSDSVQEERKVLQSEAQKKTFLIKGKENNSRRCKEPYANTTCSTLDLPTLEPCFYLHWGDGRRDQMETHDDEVLYITACNPYGNLTFRGLTITNISIVYKHIAGPIPYKKDDTAIAAGNSPHIPIVTSVPVTDGSIQIVPNRLVQLGYLCGCSCASQAVYLSIQNAKPQDYEVVVEYCIDQIAINQDNTGKTRFPITLINS